MKKNGYLSKVLTVLLFAVFATSSINYAYVEIDEVSCIPVDSTELEEKDICVASSISWNASDGEDASNYKYTSLRHNHSRKTSSTNLALNKTVTCSSMESRRNLDAKNAVDGNMETRWKSKGRRNGPEWIQVDLGKKMSINKVDIKWDFAYAKEFKIEVSTDENTYQTVASVKKNNSTSTSNIFESVEARYVRIYCTKRAEKYGYSIYEIGIYNTNANQNDNTNRINLPGRNNNTNRVNVPEENDNNRIYIPGRNNTTNKIDVPTENNNTINVTADEEKLLNLVNEARAKYSLPKLQFDAALRKCAIAKAQDMVDNNYFSHESPVYGSPFDMMKQFNISYKTAGENIAGNSTVENAFTAWMNSDGHRKNILSQNYNYVGFGIVNSPMYGKVFVQQFIGV